MGIKNFHAYAKRMQAYRETASIVEFLQRERVKTTFVDVCCVFFDALYSKAALKALVSQHTQEHFPHDVNPLKIKDYTIEEILQFVAIDIIRRAQLLQASGTRVCLVIDGEPPEAKLRTTQNRKSKAICEFSITKCHPEVVIPKGMDKHRIGFNNYIRSSVVQILQNTHNVSAYNVENPVDTSLLVAPFEADSQIVYLAENCQEKSCIYSPDGDLLCYPGALNSVRILRVNCWRDPLLPGLVVDSKAEFLDALKLRLSTEENYDNAERRLLVAAAYSGNDYAPNIPKKSISTLAKYTRSSHGEELHPINEFADKIQAMLGVAKSDPISEKFSAAVCQFAAPTVNTIEGNRIVYNPWNYKMTEKAHRFGDDAPAYSHSSSASAFQRLQQLSQHPQVSLNEQKVGVIKQVTAPKTAHSMGIHQKHVTRSSTTGALSRYLNGLQKMLRKIRKS